MKRRCPHLFLPFAANAAIFCKNSLPELSKHAQKETLLQNAFADEGQTACSDCLRNVDMEVLGGKLLVPLRDLGEPSASAAHVHDTAFALRAALRFTREILAQEITVRTAGSRPVRVCSD